MHNQHVCEYKWVMYRKLTDLNECAGVSELFPVLDDMHREYLHEVAASASQ